MSLRGGESPVILAGFSGTCGAWHLLHLWAGCCLRTRVSTRFCTRGPPRALGKAQQASGPTGQCAESKSKSSCKAVGNAADEVSARRYSFISKAQLISLWCSSVLRAESPGGWNADILLQSSQWDESRVCHLGSKVQLQSRRYKGPCSPAHISEAMAAKASLCCSSLFPNVWAFHGSCSPTCWCYLCPSPQCFPTWWLLWGSSNGSVQLIPSHTEPGALYGFADCAATARMGAKFQCV